MKAKEIIFLILIIVAGVFFYYAQTGKLHWEWNFDDHFYLSGEEYTFDESQVFEPPFPPLLKIVNAHGNVEIQGTDEQRITIAFQKKIWRKNEEEAKKVSKELKLRINKDDRQFFISTNRDEFRRKNFETNFKITLPKNMDIEVENSYGLVNVFKVKNTTLNNRHGKITASEIDGSLILQNSYENVEIENVLLDCQIENKHANIIANSINGKLRIDHRYGKIHLENISQDVTIDGAHTEVFGQKIGGAVEVKSSYEKITLFDVGPTKIYGHHSAVEVDGAKEFLEIRDSYEKIRLNNIQGNLTIDGKSLGVFGKKIVGKEISIFSSYQNIELAEFSGKTDITLSHGDVVLEPSPLTHPISFNGRYSSIKLYWPRGERYPIEARTKGGEITWKVSAELATEEENEVSVIKAFLQEKEKPSIFLSTVYGDIRIEELLEE